MIKNITQNRYLYAAAAAFVGYVLLTAIFTASHRIMILNGVFYGMLFAALFAYRREIKKGVWHHGAMTSGNLFGLGVVLLWAALFIFVTQSFYASSWGRGPWWITAPYGSLGLYLVICGGVAQILSPGVSTGYVQPRDKWTVWIGLAIGVLIAAATIWFQVSVTP